MEKTGLQIIICSGPEDARRATLGFAAGLAALASGIAVTLFLVLDGARWALPSEGNEVETPGFQPVAQLLEMIVATGGSIEVCPNCIEGICSASRAKRNRGCGPAWSLEGWLPPPYAWGGPRR